MKTFILFIAIVLLGTTKGIAQEENNSTTKSALCDAQKKIFSAIFDTVYLIDQTIEVDKVYLEAIKKETANCLQTDLGVWGGIVLSNARNGEFKGYKLRFAKVINETKFTIPGKAKRNYKKAFNKIRKDFIPGRKKKKLKEILDDKNLSKYLEKVNKAMVNQKNKYLKKITK